MHVLTALSILLFSATCAGCSVPEVRVDQGVLKGSHQKSRKGRTFSAFTGIPFAKPPVGDLRFKAPVPAEPWKGVLDATHPPNFCIQINVYLNNFNLQGDEDCLYLNVYTPQLPSSKQELLPVMFYIHGGGWMCGSSTMYGPNVLMDKDVVLVTTNYRLGALGFLTTGDEVVPGNNGLKDQNLALRWVKKNIERFGGDPNKITVFGQSAGGASTHYHYLSPLSKDLIHGAIAHSGTTFGSWGLSLNDEGRTNSKRLAEFLDCPTTSSEEMVDCLRKVDAADIINQDTKFVDYNYDPMIPFKPVIEPKHDGAFISEDPVDIIKKGKTANVPFITGLTSEDGAFKSAILYNDTKLIQQLDEEFINLSPLIFGYYHTVQDQDSISKKIREFYLGHKKIDESTKSEITDMITDGWFLLPADAAVRLHYKYSKQPVYYFMFAYKGATTVGKLFGDHEHDYGVCHGDELLYLLSFDWFEVKQSKQDEKMIEIMTSLWTNFARTGKPTLEGDALEIWKPVESDNLEQLLIKGPSDIKMADKVYDKRINLWRHLPLHSRHMRIRDEL